MVECSPWMHLLWCGCFSSEVLMDVYQVMELMLEIKWCDYFKEVDRTKLNYGELRHWIWFSFDLIV
jgi:hypothetical protein